MEHRCCRGLADSPMLTSKLRLCREKNEADKQSYIFLVCFVLLSAFGCKNLCAHVRREVTTGSVLFRQAVRYLEP